MKNTRPSSLKPRSFVAGVAIVAMALVVVFLPSSVAVAQQGGTGGLGNGGVLQLHLGSSGAAPQDYFGFRDSSGAGFAGTISQKQSIAVQSGCKLTLTPSNSLVTLSPTPSNASVGFVSDSIGIRTNSEGNGQPCGQINVPGQALTLNLAKSGKMIDYAELDIEHEFLLVLDRDHTSELDVSALEGTVTDAFTRTDFPYLGYAPCDQTNWPEADGGAATTIRMGAFDMAGNFSGFSEEEIIDLGCGCDTRREARLGWLALLLIPIARRRSQKHEPA